MHQLHGEVSDSDKYAFTCVWNNFFYWLTGRTCFFVWAISTLVCCKKVGWGINPHGGVENSLNAVSGTDRSASKSVVGPFGSVTPLSDQ